MTVYLEFADYLLPLFSVALGDIDGTSSGFRSHPFSALSQTVSRKQDNHATTMGYRKAPQKPLKKNCSTSER